VDHGRDDRDVEAVAEILREVETSEDGRLTLEEHLADIHNQADGGDAEEQKELDDQLLKVVPTPSLPEVPTAEPAKPAAAPKKKEKEEEDEMAELAAWAS